MNPEDRDVRTVTPVPEDTDLDAVREATLVVVAVPVGASAAVLTALAPALARDAVVTDVGSTKLGVIEQAREALGANMCRFVPGHPIAGTEHSGLEAGFAELF